MGPDPGRIKTIGMETTDRLGQGIGRLFLEKEARLPLDHIVQGAPAGIGDDGPPGGHGLHGRDAKVLQAGKEKGAAAGHQAGQIGVGHAPEEAHVGPGESLQVGPVAALAGDPQRQPQPIQRLYGQVDTLVGDEARDDQEVVPLLTAGDGRQVGRVDRRIDDRRLAAVEVADTGLDLSGDGGKGVDAVGGRPLPALQPAQEGAHQAPGQAADLLAPDVGIVVPHKARRGQTVADVPGARGQAHTQAKGTLVGNDQVKAPQLQPAKGQGIEQQVGLMVAIDPRQAVHPGGADVPGAVGRGHGLRPIDGGIDRRLGKELDQRFQNLLGPAYLVKPVMNDGDPQVLPFDERVL